MSTATNEATDIYSRIRSIWNQDAAEYDRRPGHGFQSEGERSAWLRLLAKVFEPL
ncbi:MAG: hypothetical protein JWO59_631, partial [Chloroflexi bacterium]|nr:hypothetical protein [Chloroflexota bacterium]